MIRILAVLTAFIIYPIALTRGTVINVPGDYPAIQQGINASVDGDTVLVQPGTYVENINFNGHNVVLGSLFLTTGDTSYIGQTVIDGDSAGTAVTFENAENSGSILTGFTIRNGFSEFRGGGIYCHQSNPTISNNIITLNLAPNGAGIFSLDAGPMINENAIIENSTWLFGGSGGGIKSYGNSTPVIMNNYISGNQAVQSGGIDCDGNAVIIGNYIAGNIAIGFEFWGYNGGIGCSNSHGIISGNIITNNSAALGGGIGCYFSDLRISNNVIIGNRVALSMGESGVGGGIYCYESSPTIINNAISANCAEITGGGIYCSQISNPVIINTIFWEDSAAYSPEINFVSTSSPILTYCDIQDTLWPGAGNIDLDPLFRDAESGDFHLMSIACGYSVDSPCIDAGDPNIIDSLLDCSWGLGGLRSDMGAYGGGDTGTVGINDNSSLLPNEIYLMQNFPNPFNSETRIKFSIVNSIEVRLAIYDLLGREVQILIDDYCPAGEYAVNFKGAGIPSGIYFYSLKAGDSIETKRMVLLK
jgi:hypothetical protein